MDFVWLIFKQEMNGDPELVNAVKTREIAHAWFMSLCNNDLSACVTVSEYDHIIATAENGEVKYIANSEKVHATNPWVKN